jgi:hypothetical protein
MKRRFRFGPPKQTLPQISGKPDAADQLRLRREHEDPAVADGAPRVARRPHVAVDVAADAVRPALDAVHHAVREELLVRELVVAPDVEDVDVALAARPWSPGPFPVLAM